MIEIPLHILDRLLILNPAQEREDARKAIEALYQPPTKEWMPVKRRRGIELQERFNIPRIFALEWAAFALAGKDVCPLIDKYLDEIGVTKSLLS